MAAPEEVDMSLLNTSCRILTLSSSLVQATAFIHRIKARGGGVPSPIPPENQDESPLSRDPLGSTSPIKIPWTISNKYYCADVHFAVHTVHGLSTHQFLGVPAVIFIWSEGQPYQDDITRISQDMVDCEPEVCLAIKVSQTTTSTIKPSQEVDDNVENDSDVDTFLSLHGFEYIDATKEPSFPEDDEGGRVHSDGIPRLPRVLDALSTIMWPSMHASSKDSVQRKDGQGRQRGHLDWSQNSINHSLSTIEDVVANSSSQFLDGTEGAKLEMQELARWLEEDSSLHQDPWQSAASTGAISMSPTSTEFKDGVLEEEINKRAFISGFDDDFTVFVSAPTANPIIDDSDSSTSEKSPRNPSSSLAPPFAGDLYRSLGSVSDFGGSDDGKQVEDTEDIDLPTEEEIRAASSRIFGAGILPQPSTLHSRDPTVHPTAEPRLLPPPDSKTDGGVTSPMSDADPSGTEDEPYDMAPFDLSRVLSALQEMKAEIATMEDEGERRKAAAKVALGLVYGLEADAGVYAQAER